MGSFNVIFRPSVEKDLRSLPPKTYSRILKAIESLAVEPLPSGVKKLEAASRTFRIRVGEYRIVYEFDAKEKTVLIHYVRHRSAAYR